MWSRLLPYALAAAAVVGLWLHGFSQGREAERIKAAAQVEALEERLAVVSATNRAAAAELEARRNARAVLMNEVEDEARNDPAAIARGISAASRMRLKRLWQAPN